MNNCLVTLPLRSPEPSPDSTFFADDPSPTFSLGSTRVIWVERHGSVLQPATLGNGTDVSSLNLARGCVHRCAFCFVRDSSPHRSDHLLEIYSHTAEDLESELSTRRKKPRAVFLSPSTDPFPPILQVQVETARIIKVLAYQGIQSWLMTRGFIRPAILESLRPCREYLKITIALTTLDRGLQRTLEPLTAPPRLRLRQIKKLQESGIPVQVALEPLLPGLTDTRANLVAMLDALAELGVRQVSTSYAYLRQGIRDNLLAALENQGIPDTVSEEYASGPILTAPGLGPARFLPRARRQRGYAVLKSLAAERGMAVSITSTSNPDFPTSRSPIAVEAPRQRLLPLFLAQSGHLPLG